MFAYAPGGLLRNRLARPKSGQVTVLEGVTVIDGTGAAPRPHMSVVLRGDLIETIAPTGTDLDLHAESVPERLDVRGCVVMPGMIDCHVHLYGTAAHDHFRRFVDVYPSVRIVRAVRDAHTMLAAGFTTVRHLGHGDPKHAQAVKEVIQQGLVAGPRVLTCGWAISQTGGHGNLRSWPYHLVEDIRPRAAFCDGPDACRKFVRQLLGDGADVIKIYATEGVLGSSNRMIDIPNFTLAEIEAITDEAHRRGVRVAAHATGLTGSKNAVLGGVDTLEHGPHAPDDELLRLLVDRKTAFVPTLSVFDWAATEGAAEGLPDWAVERASSWMAGRRPMAQAAVEAGVTVALGTDSSSTPRMGNNAQELVQLVKAGLTPLQAIRAATQSSARALGLDEHIGTIGAGKRADLLVLERDPSADIGSLLDGANLRLVIQSNPADVLRPAA
jgi:imidazolonepropionase-like amidohydrolase